MTKSIPQLADEEIQDLLGPKWTEFERASDGFEDDALIHSAMQPIALDIFRAGVEHGLELATKS